VCCTQSWWNDPDGVSVRDLYDAGARSAGRSDDSLYHEVQCDSLYSLQVYAIRKYEALSLRTILLSSCCLLKGGSGMDQLLKIAYSVHCYAPIKRTLGFFDEGKRS
jgi:hypothetical protein